MDDSASKVSIILPTHNGQKYIKQSINSCLKQTYKNIELIIVDDCSTDDTADIIKSYQDGRIVYIRNDKNIRLPSALNVGFRCANGKYLTWTSDDNMYMHQAVEKMLAFLRGKSCDFVYCDYYSFKDDDYNNYKLEVLPDVACFKYINCVRACFLYTREVAETIGEYNPDTELAEDYDYWIRVSKTFPLRHLAEPLYYYRIHGQSLYSSRYWEVEVVKRLVQMRHELYSAQEMRKDFLRLIQWKKRWLPRGNGIIANVLYSAIINRVLANLKSGSIDVSSAKEKIYSLLK